MSELPKAYEAKDVEKKWYEFWEQQQFFKADPNSQKPPFCVVMPPPNVTGVLHMGHALVNTLQDILVRYHRMIGHEVLWLPGTDHAGIATQMVVERNLYKKTGKLRCEFSREEFLKECWSWKESSETNIISQLKAQGASCDWSRKRFTMDEQSNKAVRTAFKRLFDAGLLFRGNYLVNWDPVTCTALADDEVEYEEQKRALYHTAYTVVGSDEKIVIATTRPETMLGDTAIAVSPKDPRYTHLIGKEVMLPLMDRKIPIIADDHIDPQFGTGAMKVTPGHDHNDYQIGLRHKLPMLNIMTPDGKINSQGGRFEGLSMSDAREAVVKALKESGHFVKQEPYMTRVGISYRSKAVIEPYLSKQWFVKLSLFKEPLRKAVETGKTEIIPEQWKATYFHWIDNLRDWCVSRQLWWGHQIPIWYHKTTDEVLCYDGEGVPEKVRAAPTEWTQDPDVLDTWFSSGLWPFSTLGWPEKTAEFEKFYPNNILVTGHDILFFWVARMMMMGLALPEQLPFPKVLLHGLIYGKSYWTIGADGGVNYITGDERKAYDLGKPVPKEVTCRWEKMSKSKGNVIDPNEVIAEYGADAMRMALSSTATSNPQIDLDRRRFEELKNFANKVWNGARFVFMNLETLSTEELSKGIDSTLFSTEDRWILSRLHRTVKEVRTSLEKFEFDKATQMAYEFYWSEFCAYYVEIIKPVLFGKQGHDALKANKQKLCVVILLQALRLLHPMAPFITEELFQRLKERFAGVSQLAQDAWSQEAINALLQPACAVASFPTAIGTIDQAAEEEFELLSQILLAIRNIRGEMKLQPAATTELYMQVKNPLLLQRIQQDERVITSLVRISTLHYGSHPAGRHGSVASVGSSIELFIPMPEELMQQEKIRLQKEEKKLEEQIAKTAQQLENPSFLERAPAELVTKLQAQLEQQKKELEQIKARI